MTFADMATSAVEFVRINQGWAAPVVFALAFGESLAFLSLLLPATAILVLMSPLLGAGGIPLIPVVVAGAVGSILGYGISYWIGRYFKDSIHNLWPFTRHPEMIPRGKAFFDKWGAAGVFLGHFFGPVRAVIPVVAGMYELRAWQFWTANIASSCLWAVGILAPGAYSVQLLGFGGG